jgi:hypothetical protein
MQNSVFYPNGAALFKAGYTQSGVGQKPPKVPRREAPKQASFDTFKRTTDIVHTACRHCASESDDGKTLPIHLLSWYAITGNPNAIKQAIVEGKVKQDSNSQKAMAISLKQAELKEWYAQFPEADRVIALWHACQTGNLSKAGALMGSGIGVNYGEGEDRTTALMLATINGHISIMQALIIAGANVNQQDLHMGETALFHAILLGNTAAAKLLIESGADVNKPNIFGTTPLMTAAIFGRADIALNLLLAGADPWLVNGDGETALDKAIQRGHRDVINILKATKTSTPETKQDEEK